MLGNVKRAIDGRYHAIRQKKYAHRYLAEAAWRFNHRFDLSSILVALLIAAVEAKPLSEAALRATTMLAG